MTEEAAPPDPEAKKSRAVEAAELAAETLGRDLLSAMVDELKVAPDCWEKMSQHKQDECINRLRARVQKLVAEALGLLFRGHYPATPATLVSVNFRKGIRAVLDISRSAHNRHELTDALGHQVLVVIADPEQYTARMNEIRAADKQGDLFPASTGGVAFGEGYTGGDPDPYRRDEPGDDTGPDSPSLPEYDPDAPAPDLALEPDPLWKQAQRALMRIGVIVDDEQAKQWDEAQCTEAAYYAQLVADAKGPLPPRPKFLPAPSGDDRH
jgi:hypothetical protein